MRTKLVICLLLVSVWLAGCISVSQLTAAPTVTPKLQLTPTVLITALPTISTETIQPNAGAENLISYDIVAKMDYDAKSLSVVEKIFFTNKTGIILPDILLAVLPNSQPGVFQLIQVLVDDINHDDYILDGQRLLIKGLKLPNAESMLIEVRFQLDLPAVVQGDPNVVRPTIFGVSEKQVNLTDWFPMVVPYSQQGWLLHNPAYYGEHLVYPAAEISLELNFANTTFLPIIAASSLQTGPEGTHTYQMENARDMVFAMGRQMNVVSGYANGFTVNSYFYEPYRSAGEAVLKTTLEAVDLYTYLFGPLEGRDSLSVVQGDFDDGMEFDGLYYLSNSFYNLYDGTPKQYLILVAAHETCHQWWFAQVANDQALHPWLDESLATYCEKLYYEHYHPDSLSWWWTTRVDFYEPTGFIDAPVTSYEGFTPYTNATYRQGARFLEDLRVLIGDDAFFAFLRDYLTQMRGKISTPEVFFAILRSHTEIDLSPLITKYFQNRY